MKAPTSQRIPKMYEELRIKKILGSWFFFESIDFQPLIPIWNEIITLRKG